MKKQFNRTLGLIITNTFTTLRLVCVIPMILSFQSGNLLVTAILCASIGCTDKLDGWAAKYLNGASEFGKRFDAGTDKLFALVCNVLLCLLNPVFILNLIGEMEISSLNLYARFKHQNPETIYLGKVKTVTLFLEYCLSFFLAILSPYHPLILTMILSNFVFQQVVLKKYIQLYQKQKEEFKQYHIHQMNIEKIKEFTLQNQNTLNYDLILTDSLTGWIMGREIEKQEGATIQYINPTLKESLHSWKQKDQILFHKIIKNKDSIPTISKQQQTLFSHKKNILGIFPNHQEPCKIQIQLKNMFPNANITIFPLEPMWIELSNLSKKDLVCFQKELKRYQAHLNKEANSYCHYQTNSNVLEKKKVYIKNKSI